MFLLRFYLLVVLQMARPGLSLANATKKVLAECVFFFLFVFLQSSLCNVG